MPAQTLFVIAFDELSDDRRQVVQALVKEKSDGWWWHNFPNVWIAGGESAAFWRDTMRPIIAGTKASVLVLRLDMSVGGRWAFSGKGEKFAWFKKAFS